MTKTEFNQMSLAEYKAFKGSLLRVNSLCGYTGNDSLDADGDFIVRVAPTPVTDLTHWNGVWLDPYWDVQLIHVISGTPPERSHWIDGPSYNSETCEVHWPGVQPISWAGYCTLRLRAAMERA